MLDLSSLAKRAWDENGPWANKFVGLGQFVSSGAKGLYRMYLSCTLSPAEYARRAKRWAAPWYRPRSHEWFIRAERGWKWTPAHEPVLHRPRPRRNRVRPL